MARLTRRTVLRTSSLAGAAAGIGLAMPGVARAEPITLKLAHGNPDSHPNTVAVKAAADRINADGKGKVEIQVFPGAQLGLDAAMLSQVRSGVIDFFFTSGVSISSAAGPVAAINAVAFAFKSYDEVWPAMDGDLGRVIRDQISKLGLRVFDKAWDSGYRQMTTSSKPINVPADLVGLKMRVPISPINQSLFKALGTATISLDFNELYTALQTHIADGEENPLAFISAGKLYEVQKYCSLTNHIWDGAWMFANTGSWSRLPKDVQDLIDRAFNDEAPIARTAIRKANDDLQADLTRRGMVFNQPDPVPFRDALKKAGYYSDWKQRLGTGPWAALEKYTGPLA